MSIHDFEVRTIDGQASKLDAYRGKLLLIVNVASQCGFTSQYKGFPCDQFGHQEPGDETEIKRFCSLNYDVTFPMFAKIEVNGADTHPLYRHLKKEKPGLLGSEAIKWNFTKFLVGRDGAVLKRYAPNDTPESIEQDITALLA
jgi:glutathione peroxidase